MKKKLFYCVKVLCLGLLFISNIFYAQQKNGGEILYWADAGLGYSSLGPGGGIISFGIGVKGFFDMNKAKTLSGVTLNIFIGKLY